MASHHQNWPGVVAANAKKREEDSFKMSDVCLHCLKACSRPMYKQCLCVQTLCFYGFIMLKKRKEKKRECG
jgi:hypothetical protein